MSEEKKNGSGKPAGGNADRSGRTGYRSGYKENRNGERRASGAEAYRWKESAGTEQRAYGERRSAGTEQRAYGERRSAGTEQRPMRDHRTGGGQRNGEGRKPYGEGRKPYGEGRTSGDRRPGGFRGEKPGQNRGRDTRDRRRSEKPAVEGLESRRTALQVIRKVTEDGAYASLALDTALKGSGLSAADRRLTTRLVYDTLDRMIYLDHALSQVMAREDTDIKLKNILRLGACQLLLEDRIPESAATNTSVELCVELGMEGLKGVCNGILRNLIRKKEELSFPDPVTEPEKWHAIQYSIPEWLWIRLRDDYGAEEAEKIASYREPGESITIRPNLTAEDADGLDKVLEKKIWGREPGQIPGTWHITGAMDIARDADFLKGAFSIQSESSMMAAMAVAPKRGQQILDCCAAPGGKSCLMAEMMGGTGRVQAWDVHEHRTALIEAQARRLGLDNIRPVTRDALKRRSMQAWKEKTKEVLHNGSRRVDAAQED